MFYFLFAAAPQALKKRKLAFYFAIHNNFIYKKTIRIKIDKINSNVKKPKSKKNYEINKR